MVILYQHLLDRHMDLKLHTHWLDEADRVATFPLWNLSGQLTGYQSYRPESSKDRKNDEKGRYYTYRGTKLVPKRPQTVSVWGLESWYLSKTLFVTEGIFDACRLTQLGYSAVASLSNDPSTSTLNWFFMVRQMRKVVAVCDDDPAGRKLAKVGHFHHTVEGGKDLGDSTESYVRKLVEKYE